MRNKDKTKQQLLDELAQLRRKLEEYSQQLEDTQAELKRTQKQIVQQERMAAIGERTAGLTHEFNNLLNSILGYAQILQMRRDLPEKAMKHVDVLVEQGELASELVRQISQIKSTKSH